MLVNLDQLIHNLDGDQRATLRNALVGTLDNTPADTRDYARRVQRLADRLADGGTVELSDAEMGLLREVIDARKGWHPWALESLDYFLWPEELADSDRERIAKRYKEG